MSDRVFRFGRCELRIAPKEVFLEGRQQSLAPKPFDVLVYLIEHRDRIVSKDELLDKFWPSESICPSVVNGAIMKVRRAIGDHARVSTLIKTAHRAGYQFAGELREEARPSESGIAHNPAQASPTVPLTVSLALLPFKNQTGQVDMDWVELGLMSLVVKALGTDHRLSVTPIRFLLSALEALPKEAPLPERATLVQRLLGVRYVAQVVVGREGDQYHLDCNIGNAEKTEQVRLHGPELTRLGQRLARQLGSALFPAGSAVPLAFDSADPLANRALARAMQAVGEQKWTEALNLLQVVLDIEHDNEAVLLERLRVLAALDDSEAFRLGDQLLAQARAMDDRRLVAEIHLAMGNAYMTRRLTDMAKHHLDEALSLAAGHESREWIASTSLLRASIAISDLDFDKTRELLDRVEPLCDPGGNQLQRIQLLTLRMILHAETGDLPRASQFVQKTVELNREHGLRIGLGRAMNNRAIIGIRRGHLRQAAADGEEAFETSRVENAPMKITLPALVLCRIYRLLRRPNDIRRVLGVLDTLEVGRAPFNKAYRLCAQAQLEATLGQHAKAAQQLIEACALLKQAGQLLDHRWTFSYLTCSLMLSGQTDAAIAVYAEQRALPRFDQDLELQGTLLYWQAQQAFAEGDLALARQQMCRAASTIPLGHWHADACLDGAWLHLEAGQMDAARSLLRGMEPWLNEYPPGLAFQARLLYADGSYAAATDAHRRYVESIDCEVPAYYLELGAVYAKAARQAPASPAPLPRTPRLPAAM